MEVPHSEQNPEVNAEQKTEWEADPTESKKGVQAEAGQA